MTKPERASVDELLAQAGWVRRLAKRLAHDAHAADDLAQGALASAIERPPAGDRPLRPWFARVVHNLARKERRGEERRRARERKHAESAPRVPDTGELLAELDEQRRIARVVDELREPYRSVLLLHFYRDLSAAEIGRERGATAATVRSQLARGLALVRERVEALHGHDRKRTRGALLLAAGIDRLVPAPPSVGLELVTTKLLAAGTVLVMNSTAKLVTTAVVCVAVAATAVSLYWTEAPDSLPGTPTVEDEVRAETAGLETREDSAEDADTTRESVDVDAAIATSDDPAPKDENAPTTFVARAVDGDGAPIEGARFACVTKLGAPREFGTATTSGNDGRVEIAVERNAFFTYSGRAESNTYLSLGAPGHATYFSVPAAKLGTRKDLGDIVLPTGGSVEGRVIDAAGAPVAGALVVGTAGTADAESLRVRGPDREGGRPTTKTDTSGRFSLQGVNVGPVHVWAAATRKLWAVSEELDIAPREVRRGLELVLEELPSESMVAGVVVDSAGMPVGGALIRHREPGKWREIKIHADARGAFAIPAPVATPFKLVAADPSGRLGSSAERTVRAGETDVRLELPPHRTLRIRYVRKSDQTPIERAVAISMPLQDQQFFMHSKWHYSDADGICELAVPGETFRISVGHASYVYQKFGPFEPDALPEEVFVQLEQKPMIRGIVLAGDEPVAGAKIDLVESCEGRFRPLQNGVPMRLFTGGIEKTVSDEEGRFELPTNEHAQGPPVLLVSHDGFAMTEQLVEVPEPTSGAEDVVVQMTTGGSLGGRVFVGRKRSPANVVVLISRGDGRPKLTRPDADGNYRFDNLTPGRWRVEDRDKEPEGRTMGMAQGDEHPYRWDCEVRIGQTTRHDLDLRWQDSLRVTGQLTFSGKSAVGWTAVLEEPDHADRPWQARPVELLADGSFAIDARPGHAKLVLRSPGSAKVAMQLMREIVIDQQLGPQVFALDAGAVEGKITDAGRKLRLFALVDEKTQVMAQFRAGDDGAFSVEMFPAGKVGLQHEIEGRFGMGWYSRAWFELGAGAVYEHVE